MKIDFLLDNLKNVSTSKLDDALDRMHYVYTTILLVFFVFTVGAQATFNEPLQCKPGAEFPGSWVNYVNNYCYVTGTYHTRSGSTYDFSKPKEYLDYYQWVPYVLAAQALSFYLPHMIYLVLARRSTTFNVKQVVDRCHDVSSKAGKEIDKETREVAKSIFTCSTLDGGKPESLGSSLVFVYLLSKLLHFVVLLTNIYILNRFVGNGQNDWAWKIVQNAWTPDYWVESGLFPRVTFCDFKFKNPGNVNSRAVQCLLMVNILTEKAFVILHFWFMALLVLTIVNFFWTLFELLVSSRRPRAYVKAIDSLKSSDTRRKFWSKYMSLNGSLVLRFVEEHAGLVVASKLAHNLADLWMTQDEPRCPPNVQVKKLDALEANDNQVKEN